MRIRILAISGSLRAASSNTRLLQAGRTAAPAHVEVVLYDGLGSLPHFNPDLDLEEDAAPPTVTEFRGQLQQADGVWICSPEYAHGVPGVLKNALDWVVGSGEFVGKPVALLNARPRSTHAQASLTETLTVMMAQIVPEASLAVALASNAVTEADILANAAIADALRAALAAFVEAVDARRSTA